MQTDINELEVNGVKYIRKDAAPFLPAVSYDKAVIIRCQAAGVFFGEITGKDLGNGGVVVMANARRLWHWYGALTLSDLAVNGTTKPADCKFSIPVQTITLIGCIEIIPCTVKAAESINSVKIWKQ